MARVVLPPDYAYAWWTDGKSTRLQTKHRFTVPRGVPIKLTAFAKEKGIFNNMGTALFRCDTGGSGSVKLRWVESSANVPSTQAFARLGTPLSVENGTDMAPAMWTEFANLTKMHAGASGFDRKIAVDWQWPFPSVGQNGIPELAVPVPGWREALPWLEWYAVGSLGRRSFAECSPMEIRSVVGIAIGAVGYLTGYDHERVDDTSSQYGSMGTGNDCDDFAVAAAALAIAAIHDKHPPSCALQAWLHRNAASAHVVSGYAWPNKARDAAGNKVTVGHMWCELVLTDASVLVVECTAAVAYYGGTPVSTTTRTGDLAEYISREYFWGPDSAHHHHAALPVQPVPGWYAKLAYTPPRPTDDPDYVVPPPPPVGRLVYAAIPTRQMAFPPDKKQIQMKILPFTTGKVAFALEAVDIRAARSHGSLA